MSRPRITNCCPELAHDRFCGEEKTACETLVARFEDGSLDPAPIWSDLATFDAKPLRGLVDICSAGLPCQPYSVAGKRAGHADERAIWPEFIRVVGECQPRLVFLENVPEFLKHFRVIGEKLSELGYRVEEPLFIAASDVRASHRRLRVFILAYRSKSRFETRAGDNLRAGSEYIYGSAARCGSALAEPALGGCGELREPPEIERFADRNHEDVEDSTRHGGARSHGQAGVGRGIPQAGDELGESECSRRATTGERCDIDTGSQPEARRGDLAEPAIQGLEKRKDRSRDSGEASGIEAVERTDTRVFSLDIAPSPFAFAPDNPGWAEILELAPWLNPAIESGFRCVVDGNTLVVDESRTDQLRSLGNGVVPLQAAAAFTLLMRRANLD